MTQAILLIRFLWNQLERRYKLLWLSMFVLSAVLHLPIFVIIFQMQFLQITSLRVYKHHGRELYKGIQSFALSKGSLNLGMYLFLLLVCSIYDAIFLVIYQQVPTTIGLTSDTQLSLGTIILLMAIIISLTIFQFPSFVKKIHHSQSNEPMEANRIGMIFLLVYAAGIFVFVFQLFFGGQIPFYIPLLAILILFIVVLTDTEHQTPWDILVSLTNSTVG